MASSEIAILLLRPYLRRSCLPSAGIRSRGVRRGGALTFLGRRCGGEISNKRKRRENHEEGKKSGLRGSESQEVMRKRERERIWKWKQRERKKEENCRRAKGPEELGTIENLEKTKPEFTQEKGKRRKEQNINNRKTCCTCMPPHPPVRVRELASHAHREGCGRRVGGWRSWKAYH